MENANTHPLKVVTVEDEGMKANSHPYAVEVIAGDNIATEDWVDERIRGLWEEVETLPETGEEGVTYYVAKEGETDTFDLYRWVNNGWIKIDTDVKLYSTTGENTDGPMTQKATTDATKFSTGEAVSALKIYSGLGSNTDGLVLQRYVPNYVSFSRKLGIESSYVAEFALKDGNGSVIPSSTRWGLQVVPAEGLYYTSASSTGYDRVLLRADAFRGATASAAGSQGMVPKPLAGDEDKVLKGDGTWTINYKSLNGAGAPTTATVGDYVGQLYYDTTNDKMYYLVSIDTSVDPVEYNWNALGGGPTVVQTTGTSTTDVMSQDVTTKMVYPRANYKSCVNIGPRTDTAPAGDGVSIGYKGSTRVPTDSVTIGNPNSLSYASKTVFLGYGSATSVGGMGCISIGYNAGSNNAGAIAMGMDAYAGGYNAIAIGSWNTNQSSAYQHGARSFAYNGVALGNNAKTESGAGSSVALGSSSVATRSMEVSVGSAADGTRYIANVTDPQLAQDAATKNYVDTAIASAGVTVLTNTQFNNLWENA